MIFGRNVDIEGGDLSMTGSLNAEGAINLSGTLDVTGNLQLSGPLNVTGATTLNGTLNVTGAADFEDTLNVSGTVTIQSNLDVNGDATIGGSLTSDSFDTSSDSRLKKDIIDIEGALDSVKAMRGVRYNWVDPEKPKREVGIIAQEVQAQYPEIVRERDNGFLVVDYTRLTAVLIQAVKELEARVAALEQ